MAGISVSSLRLAAVLSLGVMLGVGVSVGPSVKADRAVADAMSFDRGAPLPWREVRSEEHTSELQSRENLVCRLLLVLVSPPPTPFPYTTLFRSGLLNHYDLNGRNIRLIAAARCRSLSWSHARGRCLRWTLSQSRPRGGRRDELRPRRAPALERSARADGGARAHPQRVRGGSLRSGARRSSHPRRDGQSRSSFCLS